MKNFHIGMGVCILCLLLTALCGCGDEQGNGFPAEDEEVRAQALAVMAGAWDCEDNPLGIPDSYTGYLHLEISADGSFEMYDAEAGNPGIEGRFLFLDDGRLQLAGVDRVDFDPPPLWESMQYDQVLAYELKTETKLLLTYTDPETETKITLIFDKVKK